MLGSRRVDGQARAGSGRASGNERVNRTSPELKTPVSLSQWVFYISSTVRRIDGQACEGSKRANGVCESINRTSPEPSALLSAGLSFRSPALFLQSTAAGLLTTVFLTEA